MTPLPTPSRNTRAILIQQQERAPKVELALPAILRNPFLIVLWMLVLSTVAGALLLGRIRVPRTAPGIVVTPAADSLTPIILLPAWSRPLLHTGNAASIETGGTERVTVTIATVDATPLNLSAARHWLDTHGARLSTIDTTMVVAHLKPCSGPQCPKLTPGTRYTAVAQLGTRSLASYAIPGT